MHHFKIVIFDKHLHAYQVTYNDPNANHLIHDFPRIPPCQFYEIKDRLYIATRYKI